MLSGESALGKHPDLCVETMDKISNEVEKDINYWRRFEQKELDMTREDIKGHVAYIATATAKNLKADAIVVYTHTGDSARRLAGMGPECPILAITDNEKAYNQLGLSWNVYPVYKGDHMSLQGGLLHKKNIRSFYTDMLTMISAVN